MRSRSGVKEERGFCQVDQGMISSSPQIHLFKTTNVAMRRAMMYRQPYRRHSILRWVLLLLGIVVIGIIVGPAVFNFVAGHWNVLLLCLGAALVGAAIVLGFSRFGSQPLRNVAPPVPDTNEPLKELEKLAERSTARFKTAYRIQVSFVIGVFVGFAALVSWSMFMVSQKRVAYASAFGSSGAAMLVFSKWKWQPFERMSEARRLSDQADALATALRLQIMTMEEIKDPVARAKAQWKTVAEYIKLS